MSAFFTILFILLLVVLAVSLVKYFELPLPDSSSRKVLIGFTAAGTVLLVILLVVCSIIPGKTVSLVRNTLDSVEAQIEADSPGYTTEVLDKNEFEAFIDGSLQTSGSIEGNQALSAVLDMSGLGPFKNVFEKFMRGIDDRLAEFDASGRPFTLHNIFDELQDESESLVRQTGRILGIIILVIGLVFYAVLMSFSVAQKKGWLSARNSSLTFGD